jgi:hypothetical protein
MTDELKDPLARRNHELCESPGVSKCRVCGGMPRITEDAYWTVHCPLCGFMTALHVTKEAAVAAWNKVPPDKPKVLKLPLRWSQDRRDDTTLYAGPIKIGFVFWVNDRRAWIARSDAWGEHGSAGHLTREAAQAALEAAIMALGE